MPTKAQLESHDQVKLSADAIRFQIYNLLDDNPDGLTAYECAVKLGNWDHPTRQHTAPRLTELVNANLAVETDATRINPQTGKANTVYMLRIHWEAQQRKEAERCVAF